MAINYALEKLGRAVLYCMRSTEPLQERLHGCYDIFDILKQKGHLPPSLQARFDTLMAALTRGGTVLAGTSEMDDHEAGKWLEEILSLYREVLRVPR
jgi:hypothetical protein